MVTMPSLTTTPLILATIKYAPLQTTGTTRVPVLATSGEYNGQTSPHASTEAPRAISNIAIIYDAITQALPAITSTAALPITTTSSVTTTQLPISTTEAATTSTT